MTLKSDSYYIENASRYFKTTVSIDPESFLMPLVKLLPENAGILDVGCGSGRDLLWLRKRGHHPAGLECSPGLAALAEKHSGCPVICGDLGSHDFSRHLVDGILFVGSLVHFPHERLPGLLGRVLVALRPAGHLLVSLKEGRGTRRDKENRVFYLWQDRDLRKVFDDLGLQVVAFSRNLSAAGSGEAWLGYVCKISRGDSAP